MSKNIFIELLDWSKELTNWQNEAIRRLFNKRKLLNTDIDEIFEIAKAEHGFSASTKDICYLLQTTDLPVSEKKYTKVFLKGIRNLVNVNALKNDQRLEIGSQLTIIYGDNASGKSGYARVMKKAFKARSIEPILPNVYTQASSKVEASAIFEIEENGSKRDENWLDDHPASPCLGLFAVYDSKCARVYVNQDNQLDFVPYGFDIIDNLASITAEIKKRFQNIAQDNLPKEELIEPFIDSTSIGKFLAEISTTTKEEDIKSKSEWTADDEAVLNETEKKLLILEKTSPAILKKQILTERRGLEVLLESVNRVTEQISENRVKNIKDEIQEIEKYSKAVETAAKLAFGDLDVNGIGNDIWRELILSAAEFSTKFAYPGQVFPSTEENSKCVLCLQTLDKNAKERLTRFWKFIQDDTANKKAKAVELLDKEKTLLKTDLANLRREIEILKKVTLQENTDIFTIVNTYLTESLKRLESIINELKLNKCDSITKITESPASKIINSIEQLKTKLEGIVEENKINEEIINFKNKILELNAKKKLKDNLITILCYLNNLKVSTMATIIASKITTNAISLKASSLHEKFVTDEFKKKVCGELKPLQLSRVKAVIGKKSEKGKVLHKVTIEGVPAISPELVFSEGEKTAIALSCFLAELSLSEDNCGIIFDDPVSSLDHIIREFVSERLVTEAKKKTSYSFYS